MMSWFSSIENLQRFHDIAFVIFILSLIIGFISTTGVWLLGRQIDKLKTNEVTAIQLKNEAIEKKFDNSEQLRIMAEQKLKEAIEKTNKKIEPRIITQENLGLLPIEWVKLVTE